MERWLDLSCGSFILGKWLDITPAWSPHLKTKDNNVYLMLVVNVKTEKMHSA